MGKRFNPISNLDNEENSLDALNSIVGTPIEMEVPLTSLIPPPSDWSDIFKKADTKDIQKMAASIYKYGLFHRITLWQHMNGKYMILGGSTRAAAYNFLYNTTKDEKWAEIPAQVYAANQIDRIDAKRIFIVSNTDQRQMTTHNIAQAYYNLIKLEKQRAFYGSGIFSRDAAAKQANVSPTTFNNYLKLIKLIAPLLDEIDNGNLPMTVAYELAFLPDDFQQYVFDRKYYKKLKRKTAKKMRQEAKTFSDIDEIMGSPDSPQNIFKYQVEIHQELPENCEILPLLVSKENKSEIIQQLSQAVSDSNFSDDVKNNLLKTINAKK